MYKTQSHYFTGHLNTLGAPPMASDSSTISAHRLCVLISNSQTLWSFAMGYWSQLANGPEDPEMPGNLHPDGRDKGV